MKKVIKVERDNGSNFYDKKTEIWYLFGILPIYKCVVTNG